MCPSIERTADPREFATDVLQKLLRHIEIENVNRTNDPRQGDSIYRISHAWTDGPMMFVVYQSTPQNISWGLVRDTRRSLIDDGPWNDADNPALYYYLLDFEEGWQGPLSGQEDASGAIKWRGDRTQDEPRLLSDIPVSKRFEPPRLSADEVHETPTPNTEARRYADPSGPLPGPTE